jgi:ketosteroid isomerase-like protein
MDTGSVVRACYAAWSASDIAALLTQFHENGRYVLHVPTDILPFGGEHIGQSAVAACMQAMLNTFSFQAFAVDWVTIDHETARAQVVFYLDHTESGQHFDGRLRHVWQLDGGKVIRLDEYHDTARLGAFLQMVRSLGRS